MLRRKWIDWLEYVQHQEPIKFDGLLSTSILKFVLFAPTIMSLYPASDEKEVRKIIRIHGASAVDVQ